MNPSKMKLVTVVCEVALTSKIVELAKSLGASGFTLTDVGGEGSEGRAFDDAHDRKSKIEFVCPAPLASRAMKEIQDRYFSDYSVITYSIDVEVLRVGKFKKEVSRV